MPDDFSADMTTTATLTPGASLVGNLETEGDHDWIAVSLTAGTLYRMSVDGARSGGGTQPYPVIFLRDAAGRLEARQDAEFMRADPEYFFRPASSGTWYMDVWSFDPIQSSAPTGSYTAMLEAFPGLADVGQTVATAGAIALNSPITGLIESRNDRDWFAVDLQAGQHYVVDLEAVATGKGTLPDPSVMVWTDDQTRLPGQIYFDDYNEAVLPNNNTGEGTNSRFEFTAATDGTYYLEAARYSNGFDDYDLRLGSYTLTIAEMPLPTLTGTEGNDWLLFDAAEGYRRVEGGAGQDMLSFAGSAGTISVNLGSGTVLGAGGQIQLYGIEGVTGTSQGDRFYGSDTAAWLRGLGGRDFFFGSAGADTYDGGTGRDFLGYYTYYTADFAAVGVNASLLRGQGWAGYAAGDRYSSIEDLSGAVNGDNTLTGDHGDNGLYGWNGDDTLMGNGGDDIIHAGLGTDIILFGYDRDQYTITRSGDGALIVVDYIGPGPGDGTDTILSAEILRFADGDFIL